MAVDEQDTTPGFPDRRHIDLSRDPTPGVPDHAFPDDDPTLEVRGAELD